MSENISIKEGGLPRPFGPVNYLRVACGDNKHALWVPESTRQLGTKSIDKNGIYRASADNVYGWSSVDVNVSQSSSITGTDPDGDESVVYPDPDSGQLITEKIPSRIEVVTPPTKTRYSDGDAIDFSGIVVKGYLETGGLWGTIPFNELVFPDTTAVIQEEHTWTDGRGINAGLFYIMPSYDQYDESAYNRTTRIVGKTNHTAEPYDNVYMGTEWPSTLLVTVYAGQFYVCIISGDTKFRNVYQIQYAGSFYYYGNYNYGNLPRGVFVNVGNPYADKEILVPESTTNPSGVDASSVAETQTVPVQWSRPGDGALLESSFTINVVTRGLS